MSEHLVKIAGLLYVVHQENLLLIRALYGKEKGQEVADYYEKAVKDILDAE